MESFIVWLEGRTNIKSKHLDNLHFKFLGWGVYFLPSIKDADPYKIEDITEGIKKGLIIVQELGIRKSLKVPIIVGTDNDAKEYGGLKLKNVSGYFGGGKPLQSSAGNEREYIFINIDRRTEKQATKTLIHEIAHGLWYATPFQTRIELIKDIQELNLLPSQYARTNSEEAFAEILALWATQEHTAVNSKTRDFINKVKSLISQTNQQPVRKDKVRGPVPHNPPQDYTSPVPDNMIDALIYITDTQPEIGKQIMQQIRTSGWDKSLEDYIWSLLTGNNDDIGIDRTGGSVVPAGVEPDPEKASRQTKYRYLKRYKR